MKKLTILFLTAIFAAGWFMASCEGPAGADGEPGQDGQDGTNAAETCTDCHNAESQLTAIQKQWENSGHATGTSFARNSTSCAGCHTSQGFREIIVTGHPENLTEAEISNPIGQNCRTCHNIHENYDQSDYALTYTDPVTFIYNNAVTFDNGSANLCAKCHQPRAEDVLPDPTQGDAAFPAFGSFRWGGHHGWQAAIMAGSIGLNSGLATTQAHMNIENGCITCHMSSPGYGDGASAGGHTMTPLVSACQDCHSSLEEFDHNGFQTEVEELYEELKALLLAQDLIREDGYANTNASFTHKTANALLIYKAVHEDGSHGIHNPAFVKAALNKAISDLQ
jgi:hypothetical protein